MNKLYMHTVILGLGSNQGAREAHLREAVERIRDCVRKVVCSPVYISKALLPDGAPPEWDIPFLNMAVKGETPLAVRELLAALKIIEREMGRLPRGHWGPREIDIDILAYEDTMIAEPDIVVPHAGLLVRDFALVPLADLAPLWRHPAADGKTARELALPLRDGLARSEQVIV